MQDSRGKHDCKPVKLKRAEFAQRITEIAHHRKTVTIYLEDKITKTSIIECNLEVPNLSLAS